MEASKITVAETGNKRNALSNEDVSQAIVDIAQWFKTKAPKYFEAKMKAGAESSALAAFTAPEHLKILLSKFNGGMHFQDTFVGLSIDEIKATNTNSYLAFAKD